MLEIVAVPAFADNYIWLVHDEDSGETAVVDPGDAAPVLAEAGRRGWPITQVWNTHWHPDHTGGNLAIKAATGAPISGPAAETIPGRDVALSEGGEVRIGDARRPGDRESRAIRSATSPWSSTTTASRSSATQCSRWVAAGCSKGRRSRCSVRCSGIAALARRHRALLRRTNIRSPTPASRPTPSPATRRSPARLDEVARAARRGRDHGSDQRRGRNAKPILSFEQRTWQEFARLRTRQRQLSFMKRSAQ